MSTSSSTGDLPPDENRGPQILAICGSLVAISLVVVALRVWVRARIIGKIGPDDWVMMLAMAVTFAEMMIIIPEVELGAGRHWQYIQPPENVTQGLYLNFITQPLCLIGLCLTKLSVGLFLLRMAPSRPFRYFLIGAMAFTVASSTGNLLTTFFQCRPLSFTWNTDQDGTCIPAWNLHFAAYFNSSVSVLTDVLFALVPVPMLWRVKLNRKAKWAITGVLSLGLFAAAAAIVKITYLGAYGAYGDFLWDSADLTIWTTVEICTAIVAASIPCLKPLFKSIFDGSSARYANGAYKYGSKPGYMHSRDNNGNRRSMAPGASGEGGRSKLSSKRDSAHDLEMYPKSRVRVSADNLSEESLFNEHQQQIRGKSEGITKTMQVHISVDDEESQRKKPKDMV